MTKRHVADVETDRQIARSVRFTAFLLVSPAERYREEHGTLADARAAAARLTAEHSHFGRRAVVYAVTPEGFTLPVSENFSG